MSWGAGQVSCAHTSTGQWTPDASPTCVRADIGLPGTGVRHVGVDQSVRAMKHHPSHQHDHRGRVTVLHGLCTSPHHHPRPPQTAPQILCTQVKSECCKLFVPFRFQARIAYRFAPVCHARVKALSKLRPGCLLCSSLLVCGWLVKRIQLQSNKNDFLQTYEPF